MIVKKADRLDKIEPIIEIYLYAPRKTIGSLQF